MKALEICTGVQDFMRTVTDAEDDLQLFWQAFPAEGGAARTTYMFSYADCAKQRPSLQVWPCLPDNTKHGI